MKNFHGHENFEKHEMGFHGAWNFHETFISRPMIWISWARNFPSKYAYIPNAPNNLQ